MSKTRTAALIAATAIAALLASAGAASAAPRPAPAPSLVLALTHVTDRPDSGNGSPQYWADDTFTRTLLIIRTGGTAGDYTFAAVISDTGTFTTIKGAPAPNQGPGYAGEVIKAKVTGTMTGWADFTFTASKLPGIGLVPANENDYGTAPADTSPNATPNWYELAFPAHTTFGGPGIGDWSWTYGDTALHQQWVDGWNNGYGDLAGDGQITG